MLVIDVTLKGSEIELSQPIVASGTAGKVVLCFSFDEKWQGLAKTAVFVLPRGNLLVPLDGDRCIFPAEALAKSGRVKLGVFGTDGENTLTSLFGAVNVEHGALAKGTRAVNYTPSLYEQFSAKFSKFENMSVIAECGYEAAATFAESDGKMVLNLTLPRGEKGDMGAAGEKGADGKDGADGYTPVRGVDYWTEADKLKMRGEFHDYLFYPSDGMPIYGNILSFVNEEEFTKWKGTEGEDWYSGGDQNMIVFIAGVPKYFYSGWLNNGYLPFASPMLDSEKAEIEARFGDIETALDEIIALQESYIGGTE